MDFDLRGAFPLQEYGFEVEFSHAGGGGQYVGRGLTDLAGNLDLSGTIVQSRGKVRYSVFAGSSHDDCRARGVIRPPKRR